MISRYSTRDQLVQHTTAAAGYRHELTGRMVFNFKRWLRNRRELRSLDNDQLRDVGLDREVVEHACRLNLLQQ